MSRATPWLRAIAGAAAVGFGVLSYVYVTLPDVRPLATENPTSTAFMRMRAREAAAAGRRLRPRHRWAPYGRISAHLTRAVLTAEDDAFWDHDGIDPVQIRRAITDGLARREAPRGASTITQQLAKNLYLSPSYDPLRKLRELIIARRLEAALPKVRILEIYLNVIEWGDGIWGADAASRAYFGTPASALSRSQAALLAGAIVNPHVLVPAHPSRRLLRRQRIILARMGTALPQPAPRPVAASPARAPELPAPARVPFTVDEEEERSVDEAVPVDPGDPPALDEERQPG